MNDKKMTFDEFKVKVIEGVARRLHADVNSKKVQDRMNEPDSIDILNLEYKSYMNMDYENQANRKEYACAANCIAML